MLATKRSMHVRQGNVRAAYLNAKLSETVYVKQVKGFKKRGEEDKVRKQKKELYGLKQTGRKWSKEGDNYLRENGLTPTISEPVSTTCKSAAACCSSAYT